MKKSFIKKAIIVTSFVCLTGLGTSASFASEGKNITESDAPMHHQMNPMASEMQMKMDRQMKAFHTSTQALRQEIQSKEFELKAALSKPEVDEKKGEKLQRELSNLRADLDQKHLKHMITMQKINPELKMNMGMMRHGKQMGMMKSQCKGMGMMKGQGKHMGMMKGQGKHMGMMKGQGKHMGMMMGQAGDADSVKN